jgi:hypothetical protein
MAGYRKRGETWDLEGTQLKPFQQAQYLFKAGFHSADVLTEMVAVLQAESLAYLKAWNHNAEEIEGQPDHILISSTDIGWIQRNIRHPSPVKIRKVDGRQFAHHVMDSNPALVTPAGAAAEARELYEARKFRPWVAHLNGSYKQFLDDAILSVANFLAVKYGLGQSYFEKRK